MSNEKFNDPSQFYDPSSPVVLKELTLENLVKFEFISEAKADIIRHKATNKGIIGGKGTGKTVVGELDAALRFETEKYFNAYGFRKYKESATDKLGGYFQRVMKLLEMDNYHVKYEYRQSLNKHYQLSESRSDMKKNPHFTYGSLDNPSGTDGSAPSNGGYYGISITDEPVVREDIGHPDKIPDQKKWDEDMAIIQDNLERFNGDFVRIMKPKKPLKFTNWFFMNNWGDHPLTTSAEKYLPEAKFFEFIFGYSEDELYGNTDLIEKLFANSEFLKRIMTNSVMSIYIEKIDWLWVRMTKFANPQNLEKSKAEKIINGVKLALIKKDKNSLAVSLGFRHEGNARADWKSYPQNMGIKHATLQDFLDWGYKLQRIVYSWDIDTSRVLTLTPGLVFIKSKPILTDEGMKWKISKKVLADKQIEITAFGTGEHGELNDVYVQWMIKKTTKHYNSIKQKPLKKTVIAVDDKRKWFLKEFKKYSLIPNSKYRMFEQHGDYDILSRQDMTIFGFANEVIYNHPKNKKLEQDFKATIKEDFQSEKRKTKGSTNYLDRIDSFENATVIPLWNTIRKSKTRGE